jgi:hypothetical protein
MLQISSGLRIESPDSEFLDQESPVTVLIQELVNAGPKCGLEIGEHHWNRRLVNYLVSEHPSRLLKNVLLEHFFYSENSGAW